MAIPDAGLHDLHAITPSKKSESEQAKNNLNTQKNRLSAKRTALEDELSSAVEATVECIALEGLTNNELEEYQTHFQNMLKKWTSSSHVREDAINCLRHLDYSKHQNCLPLSSLSPKIYLVLRVFGA